MSPLQAGDLLVIVVALWVFLALLCVACCMRASQLQADSEPWPELDEWEDQATERSITEAIALTEPESLGPIFTAGADRNAARLRAELDDDQAIDAWLRGETS